MDDLLDIVEDPTDIQLPEINKIMRKRNWPIQRQTQVIKQLGEAYARNAKRPIKAPILSTFKRHEASYKVSAALARLPKNEKRKSSLKMKDKPKTKRK
jgi:hypothetical protein